MLGCSEYLAGKSQLGRQTAAFASLMQRSSASSPPRQPSAVRDGHRLQTTAEPREPLSVPHASDLEVLTLANRRSAGLCRLIRSAVLNDVPLTVLGWEPEAQSRWQEFYLASKALMSALYVQRRRMSADAVILVVDATDTVIQLPARVLLERAQKLVTQSANRVVFGAEAHCFSCSHAELQTLAHRHGATSSPSGRLFKHLNGGCVVARPSQYASLVGDYLRYLSRSSDGVAETHAKRSLYKQSTPLIYHTNDQAALQRMMLAAPYRGSFDLDYETRVCLNMFSSTPRQNLEWREHQLVSRLANASPALVHYNGRCGERGAFPGWMGGYHARTLGCHLAMARGANWTAERFEARFRDLVRFFDAEFVEEPATRFDALCGAYSGPTAAQWQRGCAEE
eukprot:6660925-Prymnesium_polylepis.1